MADAITIKALQDASLDAKSLEEVVNGNEVKQVTTRKGETYPSVKKAIKTLFENGGLPATPFATKALMTASSLANDKYAMVTDDAVNNGLYVKTAGAWVKSNYDPVAQANTYTDSSITTALNKSSGTFDTLALLTASPLIDGSFALVANDTDTTKNGHYKKVSGVWTKVAYNPYSKTEVDNKVKVVGDKATQLENELAPLSDTVRVKTSKALHQWVDSEFDIVAEIDTDAGLRLVGVEGTVQDVLNSKRDKSDGFAGNIKDLTHAFLDADEKIVMGIDKHSGLRITGTTVSLQEQIGLRPVKLPHGNYHPNEMFTADCDKYFTNMSVSGLQNAPVPYGVMPQRYTVPDNIVNELTLTPPTEYTPINTNYGDNDRVVHPYIAEFKGGFRGFRYLMSITPYTVESHENPVLLGSNNLSDWDLLDGFKQPLQSPLSGHFFSDAGLTYDPINGMLICYWRDGLSSKSPEEEAINPTSKEQEVRYSATRDGIHWTEPSVLASRNPETQWTSLTIVFNPIDGLWHMFTKEVAGLGHYKASNLNNSWVHSSTTSMSMIWHKEVKWVGDKYVLLVNRRDPESNFYFAISSDGDTWTRGTYLFTEQQDALYKATFLPKFNSDGQIAFDVLYTTNHASNPELKRRFFHTTTNYVTI